MVREGISLECECWRPLSRAADPSTTTVEGARGWLEEGSLCCNLWQISVTPTYRSKSFLPILFLHMKGTHFSWVSVSVGTGFAVFPMLSLCAVRKARLHASTGDAVKLPDTPGTLALREATACRLSSQLTKEPERLLLTGPLRSLLAALNRQNNKGKQSFWGILWQTP